VNLIQDVRDRSPVRRGRNPSRIKARPSVESLESRMLLYSASGNAWSNPGLVTISFEPDGTNINGHASNLVATLNAKFGSQAAWQNAILQGAQLWAQQTNLNFAVVADAGTPTGSGTDQQGDPTIGDIRIGGYNFGSSTLAQAYMPPPVNNYSIGGDVVLNTGQNFTIGSSTNYDLQTVVSHEIGHALGLYHSTTSSAEMYSAYNGKKLALTSDDIAGIRSIYGGARSADSYSTPTDNSSFASARSVNSLINSTTLTALVPNADITAVGNANYFSFTVPSGTNGTIKFAMQSKGLSLLTPGFVVYNASQAQVASSQGVAYGDRITTTYSGVKAGQTFYIKTFSPVSTAFGTGAYALTLNFGSGADATVTPPDTTVADGSPLAGGGGQAYSINGEKLVNTYTAGNQILGINNRRAVGMDSNGNYVVAWSSASQDGSGFGVYAQRFDVNGARIGGEFLVNTTTLGDQGEPSVAVAPNGNFVVAWQSAGQDASASLGIYAQMYNSSGARVGGEFRVNTTTAGDQQYPVVATDPAGDFAVTWVTSNSIAPGVFSQLYNASGSPIGGETQVNAATLGTLSGVSVAMDSAGYVVTWADSLKGIQAQLFGPNGLKIGSPVQVSSYTLGNQGLPSVTMDSKGNFVVTWTSQGQDGSGLGVYARRFNSAGSPTSGEFRVNTSTLGDQSASSARLDDSGDLLVVWSSDPYPGVSGYHWNTYTQQYNPNGSPMGGELQVNTSTGFDQRNPSVAMDNLGHAVVVWAGGSQADSVGVSMQQYNLGTSGLEGVSFDSFDAAGQAAKGHHSTAHHGSVAVGPVRSTNGGKAHNHPAPAHRFAHRPLTRWMHNAGRGQPGSSSQHVAINTRANSLAKARHR
jgi:hypothetical protein